MTGSVDVSPERQLAAGILSEVETGRRLDMAWDASDAPAAENRAWLRTLVYGTLRLRGRLDSLVAHFAKRPVDELDPPVRLALRLGVFQILYMRSVPAYAAVSESVALVKSGRSRGASGLVNAVLRRVTEVQNVEEFYPDPASDLVGYLSTWGSHPEWLVRRWIGRFGPEATRRLVHENNEEPDVFLNPLGSGTAAALAALTAAGLEAAVAEGTKMIRLGRRVDPRRALDVAPGVIQDPAAAWVVDYAAPPKGALVADLCAAPGGKAVALSASARAVLASDLSERRMGRLVESARRTQGTVWPVVADACRPPIARANLVFVDVPCTGTGTLKRHPDARWRVVPGDVERLAAVQLGILDGAAAVVPRDGLLVYATCTLEDEENVAQVNAFLDRNTDFRIEAGPVPKALLDELGRLVILPQESGFDGAFAARLRRVG